MKMNNMLLGKDFLFKLPGFRGGKDGNLPSTYYAGTLPEVTAQAYAPIRLTTYYPVVSKYPYTGHSELKIPIDRATWWDYTGEKEYPERLLPYVTIDKKSGAPDYNLVTNNCADATLNYLNKAFNTHESPMLFTTPGDVRDYAIHKLHGKLVHNDNGSDTVLIPRNAKNKTKISKEALDLYSNGPKRTARVAYHASFKNGKDPKKPLSDEQYIKIMEDVANANYERWGYPNQDAALLYVLNANDYDYRGYYNKYPPNSANSLTHWSDEFKTAYHPSFSDESKYSGHKSKYNPDGIVGGHWYNEMFVPSFDQLRKLNKLPGFTGGKDSGIKEYVSNEDMHINQDGSITTRNGNTGSVILPDVNVYAQKDYNSAFDYSGANEVMGTIADFSPVVGDVKQGLEAANDLRKGNYKEAAIGAGLLLLPNVLEKPLKYAGKKALNFLLNKAPEVTHLMQNIIDMGKMSKWTPEQWTAAQDAAIAKGDMVEAQRLRDLHSSLTDSATPGKYYRGTQTKRNSYPDRHIDEEVGEMNGIYLTKKPKYAKTYGDVEEFYLRSNNPLKTEGSWTGVIDDATRAEIENAGYDAVVNNRFDTGFLNKLLRNSRDETITFNGKNLKLADAVTYDDKGVRIPLGKRDNFKLNDNRYGLVPFGVGLTGYGLLKNQKTSRGSARNGKTKK